ncbi:hypothetical protein HDU97_004795 [Phlyctochytrium planicorne]|nr:hypothetical protein HDU97_004795 [Phlyctochytrium planicorne]
MGDILGLDLRKVSAVEPPRVLPLWQICGYKRGRSSQDSNPNRHNSTDQPPSYLSIRQNPNVEARKAPGWEVESFFDIGGGSQIHMQSIGDIFGSATSHIEGIMNQVSDDVNKMQSGASGDTGASPWVMDGRSTRTDAEAAWDFVNSMQAPPGWEGNMSAADGFAARGHMSIPLTSPTTISANFDYATSFSSSSHSSSSSATAAASAIAASANAFARMPWLSNPPTMYTTDKAVSPTSAIPSGMFPSASLNQQLQMSPTIGLPNDAGLPSHPRQTWNAGVAGLAGPGLPLGVNTRGIASAGANSVSSPTSAGSIGRFPDTASNTSSRPRTRSSRSRGGSTTPINTDPADEQKGGSNSNKRRSQRSSGASEKESESPDSVAPQSKGKSRAGEYDDVKLEEGDEKDMRSSSGARESTGDDTENKSLEGEADDVVSPDSAANVGKAKGKVKSEKPLSRESMDAIRRKRNTEAAKRSRDRKNEKIVQLESHIKSLEGENSNLKIRAAVLQNDKDTLQNREKALNRRIIDLQTQLEEVHRSMHVAAMRLHLQQQFSPSGMDVGRSVDVSASSESLTTPPIDPVAQRQAWELGRQRLQHQQQQQQQLGRFGFQNAGILTSVSGLQMQQLQQQQATRESSEVSQQDSTGGGGGGGRGKGNSAGRSRHE